jgi:hypothetical protein
MLGTYKWTGETTVDDKKKLPEADRPLDDKGSDRAGEIRTVKIGMWSGPGWERIRKIATQIEKKQEAADS